MIFTRYDVEPCVRTFVAIRAAHENHCLTRLNSRFQLVCYLYARTRRVPFTSFKYSILSLSPLSAVLFAPKSGREISRLVRSHCRLVREIVLFVCGISAISTNRQEKIRSSKFFLKRAPGLRWFCFLDLMRL